MWLQFWLGKGREEAGTLAPWSGNLSFSKPAAGKGETSSDWIPIPRKAFFRSHQSCSSMGGGCGIFTENHSRGRLKTWEKGKDVSIRPLLLFLLNNGIAIRERFNTPLLLKKEEKSEEKSTCFFFYERKGGFRPSSGSQSWKRFSLPPQESLLSKQYLPERNRCSGSFSLERRASPLFHKTREKGGEDNSFPFLRGKKKKR